MERQQIAKSFEETKQFSYQKGNIGLNFSLKKKKADVIAFMELLAQALRDCEAFLNETKE